MIFLASEWRVRAWIALFLCRPRFAGARNDYRRRNEMIRQFAACLSSVRDKPKGRISPLKMICRPGFLVCAADLPPRSVR